MKSPFNAGYYNQLLKGLDASEVYCSELEATSRIDSEYYRRSLILAEKSTALAGGKRLRDIADFVAGPFGSEFLVENFTANTEFRYIRGKDVKPFFLHSDDNQYIPESDWLRLADFHVRSGDILISVVGTIGNASIVTDNDLPALFSCKSTLLRPFYELPFFIVAYLNSKHGQSLLLRNARGTVQSGLNIDDLKALRIPNFSEHFKILCGDLVQKAQACLHLSTKVAHDAESVLVNALGLNEWRPLEPLSYARNFSEVFASERLDSQFHTPRVKELLSRLGQSGLTIGDIAPARREKFVKASVGSFNYIEISDIRADGTAGHNSVAMDDAPSRATWIVHSGDVLTSTVRPNRRLTALVMQNQNGFTASSGFVVLSPQAVPAEVLLTYLRLPVVCELMDLHTSASMYPAISDNDLLALPFPIISEAAKESIVTAISSAHKKRKVAFMSLETATQAIEIAIEDSESKALAYLARNKE